MASVTSLDKDMRKLRMDKYTPAAAKETRNWIEDVLGERLKAGDLIVALKDGVALCELANLVLPPPGIRFKASAMPFVQMENISHFLRACQNPPLNLQSHDVFLTVDLYESKDPAQVLQCLSAFSRIANHLEPSKFPSAIGPKSILGVVSPQGTGSGNLGGGNHGNRGRGTSNASNTGSAYNPNSRAMGTMTPTKTGDSNSGRWSPVKNGQGGALSPGGGVSSWSKKSDEGATAPAWNINQYGYMGGANQGNMGISYGGRRQITSAAPHVPSIADKEKKRREQAAVEEKLRQEREEYDRELREEQDAEEERAKVAEEQRWTEETRNLRAIELLKAMEEKRKWEEEERRWKMEEERRQKEEREAEARLENERRGGRGNSDTRLQGQFLSQYQAEQALTRGDSDNSSSNRIQELEVELARERERQYEREREERKRARGQARQAVEDHDLSNRVKDEGRREASGNQQEGRSRSKSRARSRSRPPVPERKSSDEQWRSDERDYLRQQWKQAHQEEAPPAKSHRPLPDPGPPIRVKANHTGQSLRPLPDPTAYAPAKEAHAQLSPVLLNRTDRYISGNPAPQAAAPKTTYSELGGFNNVSERDTEDHRRQQSQIKTKAGGWASKSLLEREMEMERQRQQEWEHEQKAVSSRVPTGKGVDGIGGGLDGKFDQSQWTGYTQGDGQNKGSQGIGAGRRQIIGPRPPPSGR